MLTGGAEGGKCSLRRRDGAVARRSRAVQRGVVGVVDRGAGLVRIYAPVAAAAASSSLGSWSCSSPLSSTGATTAERKSRGV
jgi:hypothetical protein